MDTIVQGGEERFGVVIKVVVGSAGATVVAERSTWCAV
jgi:hypothetical protein